MLYSAFFSRGGRNRTHLWSFGDSYSTDELHPFILILFLFSSVPSQHIYYILNSKKTQYLITSFSFVPSKLHTDLFPILFLLHSDFSVFTLYLRSSLVKPSTY